MKPSELQLGDKVRVFTNGPFGDALVIEINPEYVTMIRPYMATSDFAMMGSVPGSTSIIPLTGHEILKYFLYETRDCGELLERVKVR